MFDYVVGDVTNPKLDYFSTPDEGKLVVIPHVCNNIGAFNAGVAKAIRKTWPKVYSKYLQFWEPSRHLPETLLGKIQLVQVQRTGIPKNIRVLVVNMFAQNSLRSKKNPHPLCWVALEEAMEKTVSWLEDLDRKIEFHCPKFGCGLAGGNWDNVETFIQTQWAEKHDVLIYRLGDQN